MSAAHAILKIPSLQQLSSCQSAGLACCGMRHSLQLLSWDEPLRPESLPCACCKSTGIHAARRVCRHEPRWYPELEPESKLDCLRESFANGTARVEFSVYSQYGEDGIIEAIFRCIGHRDKCALASTSTLQDSKGPRWGLATLAG